MIDSITFGEKLDVTKSTRRLTARFLIRPLSAPLDLCALELSVGLSLFVESYWRHIEWFPQSPTCYNF
ncbi:hypothetical protein H5410_004966 [Solanum commersonii]|uniref:Uncharacterized protein n=1 Tax=Solanum commersonii TaxID=4109 RepID=A0A9J6A6C1_SOLCO|nr:hypothetical protein H5410_004966 [Solanum commersonii]